MEKLFSIKQLEVQARFGLNSNYVNNFTCRVEVFDVFIYYRIGRSCSSILLYFDEVKIFLREHRLRFDKLVPMVV